MVKEETNRTTKKYTLMTSNNIRIKRPTKPNKCVFKKRNDFAMMKFRGKFQEK
jgi:hypothetical protein